MGRRGRPAADPHRDRGRPPKAASAASTFVQQRSRRRPRAAALDRSRSTALVGTASGAVSMPVELQQERTDVPAAAGAAGRRASCCRRAAASPTAASCSTMRAGAYLVLRLPELTDPRRARRGLGHVVGRDARRAASRRPALLDARVAGAAAGGHRAERPAGHRLPGRDASGDSCRAGQRGAGAARSSRRSRGLRTRRRTASLKATYFTAFRVDGHDARRRGASRARLEAAGEDSRPDAGRAGRGRDGARSRRARRPRARQRFSRNSATRFTNPDRKARFEFVMPALSARREMRDAVLHQPGRREESPPRAVGDRRPAYLNHPLRAANAETHLRPALDLLRRFSGPATSSSRRTGWTRRSAATDPGRRPTPCDSSSPPTPTTRSVCAA